MESAGRLRASCDKCTTLKTACDGATPCARCVRIGNAGSCVYSVCKKRGPRPAEKGGEGETKKARQQSAVPAHTPSLEAGGGGVVRSHFSAAGTGFPGTGHPALPSLHSGSAPPPSSDVFLSVFWPQHGPPVLPSAGEAAYLRTVFALFRSRASSLVDEAAFYKCLVEAGTWPCQRGGGGGRAGRVEAGGGGGEGGDSQHTAVGFVLLYFTLLGLGASMHGQPADSAHYLQQAMHRISGALLCASDMAVTAITILGSCVSNVAGGSVAGHLALLRAADGMAQQLVAAGEYCRPTIRIIIFMQRHHLEQAGHQRLYTIAPSQLQGSHPAARGGDPVRRLAHIQAFAFQEALYGMAGRPVHAPKPPRPSMVGAAGHSALHTLTGAGGGGAGGSSAASALPAGEHVMPPAAVAQEVIAACEEAHGFYRSQPGMSSHGHE